MEILAEKGVAFVCSLALGSAAFAQQSVFDGIGLQRDLPTNVSRFVVDGDRAFFVSDSIHGRELHVTDATAEGTQLVVDLATGQAPGVDTIVGLVSGRVIVKSMRGDLWLVDPQDESATPFSGIPTIDRVLGEVGGRLVCIVQARTWSIGIDGSALALGPSDAALVRDNGRAYLCDQDLYETDGTVAGTTLLAPQFAKAVTSRGRVFGIRTLSLSADELVTFDPHTHAVTAMPLPPCNTMQTKLAATPGGVVTSLLTPAGRQLWASDGTPAGTSHVVTPFHDHLTLSPWRDRALLLADDGVHDLEPWITDGTAAGTRLLADLTPGPSNAWQFAAARNGTYFSVRQTSATTAALMFTDGTRAGTRVVFADDATHLTIVGSRCVFSHGGRAMATDLGATHAVPLLEESDAPTGVPLTATTSAAGGALFFVTDKVRSTNGTAASTTTVDHEPFLFDWTNSPTLDVLATVDDSVLVASLSGGGPRLVRHDAVTGTRTVVHVPNHPDFSWLGAVGDRGDRAFLVDTHLVITDGTSAGSVVVDLPPGASLGSSIVATGQHVFLVSGDLLCVLDLATLTWTLHPAIVHAVIGAVGERAVFLDHLGDAFVTDGTVTHALGTRCRIEHGTFETRRPPMFPWRNRTWLLGDHLVGTDGTAAGTITVSPPVGVQLRDAAALDDAIYCVGDDAIHGKELWRHDGTSWSLVSDLLPGPRDGVLAVDTCGDRLFLAASNGTDGIEPYVSDGTVAGTRRIADLMPGRASSMPMFLRIAGDHAYFAAKTPGTGSLMAVPLGQLGVAHSERIGQGCVGRGGIPQLTTPQPPRLGDATFRFELAAAAPLAPALFAIDTATMLQQYGPCRLRCAGGLGTALRLTNGSGGASWNVPIPASAVLLGLHVTAQGVVFDAFASGPGFAVSTALGCVVGG